MEKLLRKLGLTIMVSVLLFSGVLAFVPNVFAAEGINEVYEEGDAVWEDNYDEEPINAAERYASDRYSAEEIAVLSQIAYEKSINENEAGEGQIVPFGVKSKAVIKVSQLLLKGGDEVIDAARAFNIIDSATAKTFKSNSVKIGNFLKKFENAGANAANEVRTQLPVWFKDNTRVSKGVAENISIAVAWAIRGADWLFF